MSDVQMGPGWWLASNGKWYPPLDQAPKPGWWVAADGKWYPPKRAPREAGPTVDVVPTVPSVPTQVLEAVPAPATTGLGQPSDTGRLLAASPERSGSRPWGFPLAVLVGGAVLAIASAMPWATASVGTVSVSVAGTDDWGDGWITLGIGFALLLVGGAMWAFSASAWRVLALVSALAGLGMAIYELVHVTNQTLRITTSSSLLSVRESIAYGLVALVVGGVIALGGAVGALVASRRSDAPGEPHHLALPKLPGKIPSTPALPKRL